MIDKKKYITIELGNLDVLHKLVYETQNCDWGSEKSAYILNETFRMFQTNPELTMCGPLAFETLNMKHDGMKWIITFLATEKLNKS